MTLTGTCLSITFLGSLYKSIKLASV
jgi:hypothetical protein